MGMGATQTFERVAARLGLVGGGTTHFEPAFDVPHGGVLVALPALLAGGLLRHTGESFSLPSGYYRIDQIFLLLALMSLCRIRSIEALRYVPPGEWGKLLGLDRIPEVRTLRAKVKLLAKGDCRQWSAKLCEDWMKESPDIAAHLYVDGHVRVYHGSQTKLPRHHIARQRLCLRATTDYWVNAMDGQPFFVVNKAVDPGLIQVIEHDLLPRLIEDVPDQPSTEALAADPLLHRFTLIFDREGYSPEFFARLKRQRVACVTYHKYSKDPWPPCEFQPRTVPLVAAGNVTMQLAERGTRLANGLMVREIRKLTDSGKQTAILTTNYRSDPAPIAAAMFGRWSQENFFRYMRQHYGLDKLATYQTEDIPDSTRVVNPAHRELDGRVRKNAALLARTLATFGALQLKDDIAPTAVRDYQSKKEQLQEKIETLREQTEELKAQRKQTPRHITIAQLPEEARFKQLSVASKHFIDTVKMIAYRAETAMAHLLGDVIARKDDARSVLRGIYASEADILPDEKASTLTVRIHHQANQLTDNALRHLCDEINLTDTYFPGTKLRLVYEVVS